MKITIIDNGSRFLSDLINFAKDGDSNQIELLKPDKIDPKNITSDLLILSGGHKYPVSLNPEQYESEINLIKTTGVPILGVCLGFEIIAYTFDCELERMHNKETTVLDLEWLVSSPISESFSSIKIQEHHRWRIKNLSNNIIALAQSIDGVEIIKHQSKPIYGFQFHPELNDSVSPAVFTKMI
jgi:GMP synthase-like glutamine amidotransferase